MGWSVTAPGPDSPEFLAWLLKHDIDPQLCRYVEIDVLDIPLVRAELYVRDERGRLIPRRRSAGPPYAETVIVERALLCDPPCPSWPPT